MSIVLVGLNHKTASLEIRERVSLSKPQIVGVSQEIKNASFIAGCAILSTCNRTEFYINTLSKAEGIKEVINLISSKSGYDADYLKAFLYIKEAKAAVSHLFTVAAGLDSMILGESQIQGQVQDAYEIALDNGISDNVINTLLMNALSVGKRVRTETQIDREAVSISSAAVALARNFYGSLEGKEVLVLGAGETSELTSRHLVSNGIKNIIVANRTFQRAQRLANEISGSAVKFDELSDYIDNADIIISSTASPVYVLTKNKLKKYFENRSKRILLIDIAVPRDIDPALSDYSCVTVYDIDDLKNVITSNMERRKKEAITAQNIVDEELNNFLFWLESLTVVPTIVKMREQINKIKEEEIDKAKNRIENITARESQIIDKLANSIVNRWLHQPMINMKYLAGKQMNEVDCYIRAINELWGLNAKDGNE